ncbi:hypothetical protein PoB_000635000 [Plakobranchus ocellatus]|uniref:Uncharacterized protein n=1 Tax=Plakobranchus ocellatus TaxID=259542 RepID=A0AAV3YAN8_9GAST|nr:hypothetical protein PoB_000635000 [Plakobranchus ocellatus]
MGRQVSRYADIEAGEWTDMSTAAFQLHSGRKPMTRFEPVTRDRDETGEDELPTQMCAGVRMIYLPRQGAIAKAYTDFKEGQWGYADFNRLTEAGKPDKDATQCDGQAADDDDKTCFFA